MTPPLDCVLTFIMVLCFLYALWGCVVLCICVHIRVIEGRATKEKSTCVCQKENVGLIKGIAWWAMVLLIHSLWSPFCLCMNLWLKPNLHRGVWVYGTHGSQTSLLKHKARTICSFPVNPLNPPIASFSVNINFLQVWSEVGKHIDRCPWLRLCLWPTSF